MGRALRPDRDPHRRAASSAFAHSSSGARSSGCLSAFPPRPLRRRSCRGCRGEPTSRSVARRRAMRTTSATRSSTTRPGGTATRAPRRRRSSRRSSSTTSRGTAGTTSATTSSSTASARSTRGASAVSTATSSERTRRGSTPAPVGVAVLGTHSNAAPSKAAQDAVAALLAWRLDLAHVDPTGLLNVVSSGSNRYAKGVPVLLRAVSGHRDTGFTDCPGNAFYARLNALAAAAAAKGLPKIYEPRVETGEGLYRFRARLSSSLPWTVTVTDRAGLQIAQGVGYELHRRLDVGLGGCSRRQLHVDDSFRLGAACDGTAAGGGRHERARDRGGGVSGDDHAERGRAGRRDGDRLPAHGSGQRDGPRRGCGRRSCGDGRRPCLDARGAAHGDGGRSRPRRRALQRCPRPLARRPASRWRRSSR